MRGKHELYAVYISTRGSIPACAGETWSSYRGSTGNGVYPRLCGGNHNLSSPLLPILGLSPLVRGKRHQINVVAADPGSIPACAGETVPACSSLYASRVYPRLCGGNPLATDELRDGRGLSPLVRGKLIDPEQAGQLIKVYPRLCGGNVAFLFVCLCLVGLSPLVRGKPSFPALMMFAIGSIPACAGETTIARSPHRTSWVYPRLCGGNADGPDVKRALQGLSPLVRGKLLFFFFRISSLGSIPACAGETLVFNIMIC